MNRSMRKLLLLCIFFLSVLPAASDWAEPIFQIDIPIAYGEDEFISRIDARTGNERPALGLVLSGGSARAFAHIGVLEYLEGQGIVPDFIISNSMGSIVGLLYSAGLSPAQIYRLVSDFSSNALFKLVLPIRGGMLNTSGFLSLISMVAGEQRLEELPIPVMVIGEDLVTKRQIQIAEGDLMQVLQASYALPFYFSPVPYNDHLIVDGGFTNLVPVATAKKYADTVIVSTTFYQNPNLNLMNPLTALNVAVDISKTRKGIEELKQYEHILIRSDVEHFSFMAFDSIDEIRLAGYHSAEKQFFPETFPLADFAAAGEMGVTEDMIRLREEYDIRLDNLSGRLGRDLDVPRTSPTWEISPLVRMSGYPNSRMYLRDELLVALEAGMKYQGYRGSLFSGGMWETRDGNIHSLVGGEVSAFWGPLLYVRGGARYQFGKGPYGFGMLEGYYDLFPGMTMFGGAGIESEWDTDGTLGRSSITGWAGFIGDMLSSIGLYGEGGFQLREFSDSHFFGDIKLKWNPSAKIRIAQRVLHKRSYDGSDIPLYSRDDIHSWGVTPNDRASVFSLRAGYEFSELRPTFGELLMLKEVYAGLYGEVGFYDETAWAAGITLGARVSLIGLEEISFFTDIGYDSSLSSIAVSFYLQP